MVVIASCGGGNAPVAEPSIVVLSIDSLRVDALRPFAPDGVEVPAIAQLVARGTAFDNAWAVAPWTAPSMVSVFTGLYPPSHGVVFRDDTTPADLPTLFRILGARGYQLGNLAFFSAISYYENLGLPEPDLELGRVRPPAAFGRWLATVGEARFAAWVHLVEPHLPYGASGWSATTVSVQGSSGLERAQLRADVPVGSVEFAAGDRATLRRLYERDVAAADGAVGELMAALATAGRLADTIVVLVADHGEELLDHGWIGHASTAVEAKLVPEVLHIPLVLAGPGIPAGVRSDTLVQQVDLLPTLLRLLDLPVPADLDGLPIRLSSRGAATGRHHAFFDSSAGGNLTPEDRRGERLQGVTDGRWILQRRYLRDGETHETVFAVGGGGAVAPLAASLQRMRAALASWQERQARRQLERLSDPASQRPAAAAVAQLTASLVVTLPGDDAILQWSTSGGVIGLDWRGEGAVWIEYEAGSGPLRVTGAFPAGPPPLLLGPFPRGFWNDIAAHGPYRFRVVDIAAGRRSPWVSFTIARVG